MHPMKKLTAGLMTMLMLTCGLSGCSPSDTGNDVSSPPAVTTETDTNAGPLARYASPKQKDHTLRNPVVGTWKTDKPVSAPIDTGLDRAWLECEPVNTNSNTVSWQRSEDHTRIWLHTETAAGNIVDETRSCMDRILQLGKTADPADAPSEWEMQTAGQYRVYQKRGNGALDIVWQYGNLLMTQNVIEYPIYRVTMPDAWYIIYGLDSTVHAYLSGRDRTDLELCHVVMSWSEDPGDPSEKLIETKDINGFPIQLWVKYWAYIAVTDPDSVSQEDARAMTEMQSGGTVDYDQLVAQIKQGDTSGLAAIDEYLRTHVTITATPQS